MQQFELAPPDTRIVELENGNKLNMERNDPYGFITFSLEHGQLPESMKGSFTDWTFAEIAAKKYVAERQTVLAEIKHKDPIKKAG